MKRLFVPGVFDVFHVGHLNYLKNAAAHGDYVIVGVQDDREVQRCKNVNPIIPLPDRIAIIEALRFVDEVVSYTDAFQGPLLEGLEIDIFACGDEYGQVDEYPDQKRTLKYCEENNVEVVHIPRTHRVSSTNIRGQLKNFWDSRAKLKSELSAGVTVLGSFQGDQQKVDEETQIEVDMILAAAGENVGGRLLDLGCGDGRQLGGLCPKFEQVVGVDFSATLLDLAKQRLGDIGKNCDLVEADVSEYTSDEPFDVILLSGIIPCLDDLQMDRMIANIGQMSKPNSKLLVRSSIGLEKRINVVNQFSLELKERYTAYYRLVSEIEELFEENGWNCENNNLLYQHREDTAVWWFDFSREEQSEERLAS